MNKRWLIIVAVAVLAAAGAYIAWGQRGAALPEEGEQEAPREPVVSDAGVVIAEGEVVPIRESSLSFAVGGIVAEVFVEEGEAVTAGQVLARLDARQQAAAVAQAEADVQRAIARLNELKAGPRPQDIEIAQAAVALAQLKVGKLRADSARSEDIRMAEAELRQAQAELELTRLGTRPEAIAVAEAEVAVARAALQKARAALAETELRAPFAGTIAELDLDPGEYVQPGTEAMRLADLSTWRVRTRDLTEIQVADVRPDQPVTIRFDALPDLEIEGRVLRVDTMGVNKQGDITYTVLIELAQQDPRLRWNMTTTVEIKTD
ncbi:MAG TPA: HlyD family efflux transporter periplasmic adaptor subunit [Bacillota bacterium]